MKEKNITTKTNTHNKSLIRMGKYFMLFGIALMVSVSTMAQDPTGDPDDEVVPFDGGISALVAAGVAYGAKQWRDGRKAKGDVNSQKEVTE